MFSLDPKGWILQEELCLKIPSPNCNERPSGTNIDLIVIHGITVPEGKFGGEGIFELFTNKYKPLEHLKVSAHFLIRRDGKLVQFVSTEQRAWHAGASAFLDRENCNDFSIGIELEGTDEHPYAELQYKTLMPLLACLQQTYPLITEPERIVGHSEIAIPRGRKSDPGEAFDWARVHFKDIKFI
jgi:AmpD protein